MAQTSWEWTEVCEASASHSIKTWSSPQAFSSTSCHTSRSSRQRSFRSSSSHQHNRDSLPGMSEIDPERWGDERVKRLIQNRNRYIETSYVLTGIPPDPSFTKTANAIITNAGIPSETTTFTTGGGLVPEPEDCPCHGQGCKIDHSLIRYAKTINPRTGESQYVQVKEDTGTEVNWISPRVVNTFDFEVQDAPEERVFLDFRGNQFQPKGMVTIPLAGKKTKTQHTEFYVAPEGFPVDGVVVGTTFIQRSGHAHAIFTEKPEGPALLVMQKKVTESERLSIQVARSEADGRAAEIDRQRQQRASVHRSQRQAVTAPLNSGSRIDRKVEEDEEEK